MKFDKKLHQKVRYDGQLYAVLLEEYPDYHTAHKDSKVVIHPMGNDWIVRITNPTVRQFLEVTKGDALDVPAHTRE